MDVKQLRTPPEILSQVELPRPQPILPWNYASFEDLLVDREKIRVLQLTPVKTDEDQAYYKTFSRVALGEEIKQMMGDQPFLFLPNRFPYALPPDVDQKILWINLEVTEEQIERRLQAILGDKDAILLERSSVSTTPLAKGTIPSVRHIHVWAKIEAPEEEL